MLLGQQIKALCMNEFVFPTFAIFGWDGQIWLRPNSFRVPVPMLTPLRGQAERWLSDHEPVVGSRPARILAFDAATEAALLENGAGGYDRYRVDWLIEDLRSTCGDFLAAGDERESKRRETHAESLEILTKWWMEAAAEEKAISHHIEIIKTEERQRDMLRRMGFGRNR